jgi:type VI secretion system protein VasD
MTLTRSIVTALVGAMLAGCGLFGSSAPPARPEPRRLHITLVGGSQLNPGPSGRPNPIQACIYVVRSAGWAPLGDAGDTKCAGSRDDAVAASSRQVIAPNQVLQLSLDPATQDELWLLVDADYAQRPPNYAPLRMHVDGSGLIHYAIWLDGDGIHDALRPGPVPIGAIAAVGVAAVAVGVAVSGATDGATSARANAPTRSLSRFGRQRNAAAPSAATPQQDSSAPPAAAAATPASGPPVTHVMPNTIFKPVAPVAPVAPAAPPPSSQVPPPSDMTPGINKTMSPSNIKTNSADFVVDKSDARHVDGKAKRHLRYDLRPGGAQ